MKSGKWKVKSLSRIRLFATPWTVAHQAPPSMGFSRQEYWSGLPFPPPVDLPDPGIELRSPALQADALTSEPPGGFCMERCKAWARWNHAFDMHHSYLGPASGVYSSWVSSVCTGEGWLQQLTARRQMFCFHLKFPQGLPSILVQPKFAMNGV